MRENITFLSCPLVLVRKKHGTVWFGRFCVDYQKLKITVKDSYPLPRIEDCLDVLSGLQWF